MAAAVGLWPGSRERTGRMGSSGRAVIWGRGLEASSGESRGGSAGAGQSGASPVPFPPVPGPSPGGVGRGGRPRLTSGEGFIKARAARRSPTPEPSRSGAASASRRRLPRPTRRRDAVVPPPVRPGPALHRPGPRHRLGRPLGPAAPAVPAEVAGRRRREAGESPEPSGTPRAARRPRCRLRCCRDPASLCRTPAPCPSPGTPAADPSPALPMPPILTPRPLLSPSSPTDPWFPAGAEPSAGWAAGR